MPYIIYGVEVFWATRGGFSELAIAYTAVSCVHKETKSKGGTQALGVTPNFGIGSVLKAVRAMDDKAKATEIENDINACYANQPG